MAHTCYLLITSCCFTIPNTVKAILMISSAKCHPKQWLISKQKDLFTSNNQKTLPYPTASTLWSSKSHNPGLIFKFNLKWMKIKWRKDKFTPQTTV